MPLRILSYILGAMRDGTVSIYGKHSHVSIYSRNIQWLEILKKRFRVVFKREPKLYEPRKGTPYIRIYSKGIAEEFVKRFGYKKFWETPKIIKENSEKKTVLKEYIAGFYDSDGGYDRLKKTVKFYQSWNGRRCPPLEDLKTFLEKLGLSTGKICCYSNRKWNNRFVLRLSVDSSKKFFRIIPVKNDYKVP